MKESSAKLWEFGSSIIASRHIFGDSYSCLVLEILDRIELCFCHAFEKLYRTQLCLHHVFGGSGRIKSYIPHTIENLE